MDNRVYQCAQCQRRLPQDISFCPQCGHAVEDAIASTMMDPPTAEFASPFPPRTNWQLTLVRPDGQQVVFPLSDKLRIGRSDENELPLQDHEISRFHAQIEKVPGGFQISDLGSTNGTFVNRTRIHVPVRIRLGDTITIGQFRLLVQRDSLICGHCAQLVKSDFLFCPHCGDPLTGLSTAQEAAKKRGTDRLMPDLQKGPAASPAPELPKRPSASHVVDPRREPIAGRAENVRPPVKQPPLQPPPIPKTTPPPSSSPKQQEARVPARQMRAAQPVQKAAPARPPQPQAANVKAEQDEENRRRIILGCAIALVVGLCGLAAAAVVINQLISQGIL